MVKKKKGAKKRKSKKRSKVWGEGEYAHAIFK